MSEFTMTFRCPECGDDVEAEMSYTPAQALTFYQEGFDEELEYEGPTHCPACGHGFSAEDCDDFIRIAHKRRYDR